MTPEAVIQEVTVSELRGRGGAGFPTGRKWSFVPKDHPGPRYLVCNADESEPGTFKDREIIEHDPHLLRRGHRHRGLRDQGQHRLHLHPRRVRALGEDPRGGHRRGARRRATWARTSSAPGYDLEIVVHRGAGAYICGEETALIESIEGKRGFPRLKPPFPAVVGLFGMPTVVNNVETLACLPHIMTRGAKWFAVHRPARATPAPSCSASPATSRSPGVYELPLGVPFRDIIYERLRRHARRPHAQGVLPGRLVGARS